MRARLGGWLLIAAAVAAAACTVAPPDGAGALSVSADDAALAARLYAGTPRTPAGFLDDPAPSSFSQVSTYHLKTRDLDANAVAQHELCTDDWSQALAWSETVAQSAPTYLDLVGNDTTERYYEFDRVPHGDTQRYERVRVFRCAYLDRAGVDLDTTSTDFAAGTLDARPLDAALLGGLAEYLWRFSTFNNASHVVVASVPKTASSGLAHTLTLASLERGTACDVVAIRDWTTTADATTGDLHSTIAAVRQFSVHRVGDTVAGC
jgi:hypothetical protein